MVLVLTVVVIAYSIQEDVYQVVLQEHTKVAIHVLLVVIHKHSQFLIWDNVLQPVHKELIKVVILVLLVVTHKKSQFLIKENALVLVQKEQIKLKTHAMAD